MEYSAADRELLLRPVPETREEHDGAVGDGALDGAVGLVAHDVSVLDASGIGTELSHGPGHKVRVVHFRSVEEVGHRAAQVGRVAPVASKRKQQRER